MTIYRLLILLALYAALAFGASYIVHHTMKETIRGLKLALKSEFNSTIGRLNFIAMILLFVLLLVGDLHKMLATALSVEGAAQSESNIITPVVLLGLFFLCSLICVMVVDKKK